MVVLGALAAGGCGGDDEDPVTETEVATEEETVQDTVTETEVETETVPRGGGGDGGGNLRRCGDVPFQPNTDAGAFDILARNVSCEVARRVASDSEGAGRHFHSNRFACWGEVRENGLRRVAFDCRRDGSGISFTRS